MKHWVLKDFLWQTMLAAIYVVFVYVFQFASFGLIQFRIAEALMIFILFDKRSIVGLTLGCFVANWMGGAIVIDIIFGSLATLVAGILMLLFKKHILISLAMPALANGLIVGLILTYGYDLGPLYLTIPSVMIGEIAVLYIIGYPLYVTLKKNRGFMEFIKS